jgi:non-homologous end joining protein Ku
VAARTRPLPGIGDDVNENVRDAALKYVEIRDRRMALTKEEIEAKQDLLDQMHESKLKRYHDSEAELLVEIVKESKESVKVRLGAETKPEDVKDAIDGVTPGEDDPIAKRTMKSSKKRKPAEDDE